MRRARRLTAAGAAIICLSALTTPASALAAGLPVSGARIVVHLSLQAGQQPENIALEPDGAVDLTFAFTGQVVRVTRRGLIQPLATLPAPPAGAGAPVLGAPSTAGIVRAPSGIRYVGYSTGTAGLTGIWRLRPGRPPARVAALPPTSLANGMALGPRGMLYIADSALGVIWRVSARGGIPVVWASGAALAPAGFLGVNGLKVHGGAVWATNTDRGTLLRIPIGPGGGAGPIRTVATGLTGVDDLAFAGRGTILVALNTVSELAIVRPGGTHTIVLTSADACRTRPRSLWLVTPSTSPAPRT